MENTADAANVAPDVAKSANALDLSRRRSGEARSPSVPYNYILIRNRRTPPPPLDAMVPPPPTTAPIDVVAYQREGVGRKLYTMVRLTGIGPPSSAWLAQHEHLGPITRFDRLSPPSYQGGVTAGSSLTVGAVMPQQVGSVGLGVTSRSG